MTDSPPDSVDRLMHEHRWLVHRLATGMARRLPRYVTVDELDVAGLTGLWQAAKRWRPGLAPFPTYATPRIRGAMRDWLLTGGLVFSSLTRARRARRGKRTPGVRQFVTTENVDARADTTEESRLATRDDGPAAIEERDLFDVATVGFDRATRLLVTLRFREDFTLREAGQAVGLSEAWACKVMADAMARLMEKFSPRGVTSMPQLSRSGRTIASR